MINENCPWKIRRFAEIFQAQFSVCSHRTAGFIPERALPHDLRFLGCFHPVAGRFSSKVMRKIADVIEDETAVFKEVPALRTDVSAVRRETAGLRRVDFTPDWKVVRSFPA